MVSIDRRHLPIPEHPRQLFEGRVRYVPGLKAVYMINPKVASSSVLASMWKTYDAMTGQTTFAGNPHILETSPFICPTYDHCGELAALPFFSIVRNPFARFVSAYIDKIVRRGDTAEWKALCFSLGLSPDASPCVSLFLERMLAGDPERLDWHFCPQHVNLLATVIPLDFTGHLEAMGEAESFLAAHGIALESYLPHPTHATNADQHVKELIGVREADLIRRYYEVDFVLYGYSDDVSRIDQVREGPGEEAAVDKLAMLVALYTHDDSKKGTG